MSRPRPTVPKQIALWRHEVIEEALDPALTRSERRQLLGRACRAPVRWPSGAGRRPSLATLYRWIAAYKQGGLAALRPRRRRDRGLRRARLPDEIVRAALRYLQEDFDQPWTFLVELLRGDFPDARIPRSTLHRRVVATPEYAELRRTQRGRRRRRRFVAREAHQRWQADAVGPFTVRLASGQRVDVHVLSILDDATRAVLAARVVTSPNLAAAVRTFREATERWGLSAEYYADRASIFDAHAFRAGMADLGVRRIPTRAGNAPARGKIEAYQRVLRGWFVRRLRAQKVVDLAHLQQLLDGVIAVLYQQHHHRGLRMTVEAALNGRVSQRQVPRSRLHEAFLEERRKKAHPTTGEVELQDGTWLVPGRLRGLALVFLLDPAGDFAPLVVEPGTEHRLTLKRAAVRPEDVASEPVVERWGEGPLQKIYDRWTGTGRPQAEAGFGLPELHGLLGRVAGRPVPRSEHEAALVQRVYRAIGPLPRRPCEAAFEAIGRQLGAGRPVKTYLDALAARVVPDTEPPTRSPRRRRK